MTRIGYIILPLTCFLSLSNIDISASTRTVSGYGGIVSILLSGMQYTCLSVVYGICPQGLTIPFIITESAFQENRLAQPDIFPEDGYYTDE